MSNPVVASHFGAVQLAVSVFAWARLSEATTAPVVGVIVSVPSEFETEVTELPPEQLPAVHAPPLPTMQSPFTGAMPVGFPEPPGLITRSPAVGHVNDTLGRGGTKATNPNQVDPFDGAAPTPIWSI